MKVVLDTNIIVSSFYGGIPSKILDLYEDGRIDILLTTAVCSEIERVLLRVIRKDVNIPEFMEYLKSKAIWIKAKTKISVIKNDPSDNKFLECAVDGKADYIVSGDKKHILPLRKIKNIPILTPKEFLDKI
ncbi:putative toxin-antitoxin system toxin component, PIN family [Candidatus Margulisiibacteriota bacterium]